MKDVILSPIPLPQLIDHLREVVKAELKASNNATEEEKLISPNQACQVFEPAISKVTLNKWTRDGHLKRYDIGGRVYYKKGEIMEAAKSLKRYQKK